jgi:hypothetical protein
MLCSWIRVFTEGRGHRELGFKGMRKKESEGRREEMYQKVVLRVRG